MIDQIYLKGFKSIEEACIALNKLTILTGLNSSGKSSVIQAIRMLEKGAKTGDVLLDGHGNWDELICDSSQSLSIEVISNNNTVASVNVESIEDVKPKIPSDLLTGLTYLGADRFGPQSYLPTTYNNKIGEHGENLVKVIEHYYGEIIPEGLQHVNAQGRTFWFNLQAWINIISPGTIIKYELKKNSDTSFVEFDDHRPANVGFGLSYATSVIAALLIAAINRSMVIIENPEAHLHPKGQTEMGKLIALVAHCGGQVIIETHSDHLFDGIRIMVKNQPELADEIIGHWFELDENRLSKIQTYSFLENGNLDEWPEGMFDQFEINASELL